MDRRTFIARVAFGLVAAPMTFHAQPAGNVRRIGYLAPGPSSPADAAGIRALQAFRQGMRELRWVEGQNIVINYRFAEGKFDRLPALAAELVRLNVELIVATTTPAAAAAKNATATIPIVMVSVGDPVGLGLIASLARPGGNVTGQAFSVGTEVFGKQLELLKEVVPKVRRVAILSNPANPSHALAISNVKAAARSLGVELHLLEARDPDEFDSAFAAMVKERVGALLVVSDPMFGLHAARLADLAGKNQLPSMHGVRQMVDPGGLIFYGPNLPDLFRRAATYVDKILKGAKPADLPVQQPTNLELIINMKTAKALGLTIPQSLLLRADEVIQ
ncbi:ABC transporter substrate-binding protein [Variovorax guangxiensis]|uniref:ABC transporter substrate-binding protein n=1 Tax=Variovorax guangxiensis TaxID=1775474 RepID=UPI00285C7045|nr:ABC transporter substrate-binding protein [Variovorax guangxiensis]MDR6861018.1 putative ABC transport system substrate-binding protein [Variovorax guangxiensis]